MANNKILVVEDELLVALVYEEFLGKQGYTIDGPYTTGHEALESLSAYDFDAALLDIQLDDNISGIKIAEKIREKSNVPIVFTTGNNVGLTERESNKIENSFILPKPIDFKILKGILDTIKKQPV